VDDVENSVPTTAAKLDIPNPEGLRNAARHALMRGAPGVTFPTDEVFRFADSLDAVMLAVAQQNGTLRSLDAGARMVLGLGRKMIDVARAGDVEATDSALVAFEAALNGLDECLPKPVEQSADAGSSLTN
jgi:hypothetical protein